jgi:hypothetical protein
MMFEVIIETSLGRLVSIETQAQANRTVTWFSDILNSIASGVDSVRITVQPIEDAPEPGVLVAMNKLIAEEGR